MSDQEKTEDETEKKPEPLRPKTVKLRTPIVLGKETVTELTFRPPTGKDFRKLRMEKGLELDAVLVFAGRLAGQPDIVIDKLEGEDLAEVIGIANVFMAAGLPGGSST